MAAILYICYFSIRQPLVQTQVIPYLLEIRKDDIDVHLLTFEPDFKNQWTGEQINSKQAELADRGIKWTCLPYHKSPSAIATAYDILAGAVYVRRKIKTSKIDILHGRVHVATLMGAIARKFSRATPK